MQSPELRPGRVQFQSGFQWYFFRQAFQVLPIGVVQRPHCERQAGWGLDHMQALKGRVLKELQGGPWIKLLVKVGECMNFSGGTVYKFLLTTRFQEGIWQHQERSSCQRKDF